VVKANMFYIVISSLMFPLIQQYSETPLNRTTLGLNKNLQFREAFIVLSN